MRRIFIPFLALLSLTACERKDYPITHASDGSAISDYLPGLDDVALSFMDNQGATGMGLVIYDKGRIYRSGYGFENYRDSVAVDPDQTLFRWASMSKSLTGLLVGRMVERGLISLDDKANELVPGYVDPQEYFDDDHIVRDLGFRYEATLWDLLRHRSGLRHFDNGSSNSIVPPKWQSGDPNINTGMEWAFDRWTGQPLAGLPGVYSYSNPGYHLAGVMLEYATGKSYEQLVLDFVAGPLGMTSLHLDKYWIDYPRRAVGYKKRRHEERFASRKIVRTDTSWMAAGGGMMSSTHDLGKFCKAFLGEEIASEELKYNILWNTGESLFGYGLGFSVSSWNGNLAISHHGNWDGTSSFYVIFPGLNICMGAFVSTRDVEMFKLSAFLQDYFTLDLGVFYSHYPIEPLNSPAGSPSADVIWEAGPQSEEQMKAEDFWRKALIVDSPEEEESALR